MKKRLRRIVKHLLNKLKLPSDVLLDSDYNNRKVVSISSGFSNIDEMLGIGGFPCGGIVEVFGGESCGKTTFSLQVISNILRANKKTLAMYVDIEHALDLSYIDSLNIDRKRFLYVDPEDGDQAIEIIKESVREGTFDIIVVDSVAAIAPLSEISGKKDKDEVAKQARMMSSFLRKLTALLRNKKTCVLFVNQTRKKIGAFWGADEFTPGGNAMKFYSKIRLELRRGKMIKKGEKVLGYHVRFRTIKNKYFDAFLGTKMKLLYRQGFAEKE